jgi:large subunit ribosomal protein L32
MPAARTTRSRPPTLVVCPECKTLKPPHRVCPECGSYDGKQVIET